MKKKVIILISVIILLAVLGFAAHFFIRAKADIETSSHPLPYLTHWSGLHSEQMLDIRSRNHAVVPTFPSDSVPGTQSYNIKTLMAVKQSNLPIDMIGTQWESDLLEAPYSDIDSTEGQYTYPATDPKGERTFNYAKFTGSSAVASANPNNIYSFPNNPEKDKVFYWINPADPGNINKENVYLRLDPLGPASQIDLWKEIGEQNGISTAYKFFADAYPDPANIILAGNNEAPVMRPTTMLETSQRFKELYVDTQEISLDDPDDTKNSFQKRVAGDGFIERFKALFDAWRDDTVNNVWKNIKFVAYNGFGDSNFRYSAGWETGLQTHTSYEDGILPDPNNTVPRTSYYPFAWDGASPEVYYSRYLDSRFGRSPDEPDIHLRGTQFSSMNWVFMLEEVKQQNPDFYFEICTWDANKTTTISPERYAANMQYSFWLLRPEVMREFRNNLKPWDFYLDRFLALTKVVDRVHRLPVLTDFWQNGQLVENPVGHHPYQAMTGIDSYTDQEIKDRYGVGRWFYLFSNLDTPNRVDQDNDGDLDGFRDYVYSEEITDPEIPVYSMALVKGEAPNREWLVYTHSPKENRTGVVITVPEYGDITVNSNIAGNFFYLKELDRSFQQEVTDAPATLTHLVLNHENPIVAAGTQMQFSITTGKDQYDADVAVNNITWSATGGIIDQSGLFTAGVTPGDYQITAVSGGATENFDIKVSNLLAHWNFDEGTGSFVDDATGRNNACYNTGSTWQENGKFGSAGSADGTDSISCDSDEYIDSPTEFTISAWINIDQGYSNAGYIANIGDGGLRNGYAVRFGHDSTTGVSQIGVYANNGTTTGFWQTVPLTENSWHHIAAEFKAGTFLRLYFDGELVKDYTSNIPTTISSNDQRFILGQGFKGSIDQVRLYNQALSLEDISLLFDESSTLPQISLPDSAITYPNRQLAIDASVTNANAFSWTKVSGPGSIVFGAPSSANTTFITDVAGSYTLRLEASNGTNSATRDIVVNVYKLADINNDGSVNEIDFTLLLFNWGSIPINRMSDINGDNITDVNDFTLLLFWWGR